MRRTWLPALAAVVLAGCTQPRPEQSGAFPAPASTKTAPAPPGPEPEPIVAPTSILAGRVVSVNLRGRFVVLSFRIGGLPLADRRLSAYRNGLKVGDVKVTRWQIDNNAVADILSGECRVGDEVRQE